MNDELTDEEVDEMLKGWNRVADWLKRVRFVREGKGIILVVGDGPEEEEVDDNGAI